MNSNTRSVYRWENGGWTVVLDKVRYVVAERYMWKHRNDGHKYRMGV